MGRQTERRDLIARHRLTERVRSEFREMPCLALTLPQACRLFGLPEDVCGRIMTELMREGQVVTVDTRYRCSVQARR